MTKHEFVDTFRGKDARDKDPHLQRVVPTASAADVVYCMIYIASVFAMLVSLYFCIVGVCIQRYSWCWFACLQPVAIVGIFTFSALIGDTQFRHVPISKAELKTYTGQYVFIHWLNNVTGYEDEWVPFYGVTEEFVRYYKERPEICIAPLDQYGRGWVAYAIKMNTETLRKEHTLQ